MWMGEGEGRRKKEERKGTTHELFSQWQLISLWLEFLRRIILAQRTVILAVDGRPTSATTFRAIRRL